MKRRRFFRSLAFTLAICATAPAVLAADAALQQQVSGAVEKGLEFLGKQQKDEGFWSSRDYPGLTGLVVQAYLGAPGGKHRADPKAAKGLSFIRSCGKPDGGIYTERMGNYNTSVCLATLLKAGDSTDTPLLEGARRYLVGAQTKDGGFGYESGGSGRGSRPDLDNTVFALEALRLFRDATRAKELSAGQDLNWKAALEFASRCQQLPATNPQAWVSDSAEEKGGFGYTPDGGGDKPARSYGTMTYAGVLSFIYSDLKKDDPRVVAALDWVSRHYTLEENPGKGAEGLFYYYHLMAKGLSTAGIDQLTTVDGRKVDWRADLARKLLSLQKADGSWSSENGRWMEKDPNLVTCYVVLALNLLHEKL